MKSNSIRYILLFALLILVGIAVAFISMRPTSAPPTPIRQANAVRLNSYLIDVAGWYEITPNERAVGSPFELTIDGLKQLPVNLGRWKSEPIQLGGEVDQWFENPDLALSSIYRDDRNHLLWFSVFGSRSKKSYVLFEHTPITSYPAAGWTLVEHGVVPIAIGDKNINVQKATLEKNGERRVALYWYLWNDFNRDPEQGVMTMRLHIPVVSTDEDAFQAGVDFLRALFPQVISWRRF
jgi:hypothetical protein